MLILKLIPKVLRRTATKIGPNGRIEHADLYHLDFVGHSPLFWCHQLIAYALTVLQEMCQKGVSFAFYFAHDTSSSFIYYIRGSFGMFVAWHHNSTML